MNPEDLVQSQLDAYNARDIEAFCACYTEDVRIENASGELLVSGLVALRQIYAGMFARFPAQRATIRSRVMIGQWVIDDEWIEGRASTPVRAVAMFRCRNNGISLARFLYETD